MDHLNRQRRFKLVAKSAYDEKADFLRAVREGLTDDPKFLPCRFLYDQLGARLFQAICELPEYYLTRAERQILTDYGTDIADRLPGGVTLVELGSGSSDKSQILIKALLTRNGQLRYVPIDISRQALEESAELLNARFSDLEVVAICGEFAEAFDELGQVASHPMLMAWLGSSIGNLSHGDSVKFLRRLMRVMSADDRLLIGCDLQKDRSIFEPAYDDALGVTAAFNLNLLTRINRELDGNFNLRQFQHSAKYDETEGRIHMHIVSSCEQTVRIGELDLSVSFRRGERIHTENSHKYTPAQISDLLRQAGFELDQQWLDDDGRFTLNLARPTRIPAPATAEA